MVNYEAKREREGGVGVVSVYKATWSTMRVKFKTERKKIN